MALAVHAAAALHALWRRRTWRLGRWEWAQLLLGLAIVPLAMTHVVGTRVAPELPDVHTTHLWVLWPMAVDPWQNARQCALVIVVWLHACIGVHFWWRLKPWYPRVMPWLYALALLLPAMALAGAGVALGSVLMLLEDPAKMKAAIAAVHLSRLAEEMVIWTSGPFRFVRLSDAFTTGSSIMPQKRNPDAAELVRAKSGAALGAFLRLATILKGLPLTYGKDMQDDKPALFEAADALELSLAAMAGMIADMTAHPARMRAAAGGLLWAASCWAWRIRLRRCWRSASG